MKYDELGTTKYYDNFSTVFASLAKGCHLVFNDSRVLDARLFVTGNDGTSKVELMILDLGSVDVGGKCSDTPLQAMIRATNVQVGDTFEEHTGNVSVEVVGVKG
jgi:S-adenosylmethionine:tRNA-ribosyltransferase-isomerase (queuine synthetase)